MRALILVVALGLLAAADMAPARLAVPPPSAPAVAQEQNPDPPYDGRFTFVRIQYELGSGMRSFGGRGFGRGREPAWAHDYPRAETHFSEILSETTMIDPYRGGSRILRMDDPEVFKYPMIYVVEVGSWNPSDAEIAALGEYLEKGGFLFVDDFRDRQLYQMFAILERAAPGLRPMEVPVEHEIFDSFFRIDDPASLIQAYDRGPPVYLGLFEDNDPHGRLMAILNYNNDLAEYWEFSDYGYYPIALSNEAYKFGVNYVVYAMTH